MYVAHVCVVNVVNNFVQKAIIIIIYDIIYDDYLEPIR